MFSQIAIIALAAMSTVVDAHPHNARSKGNVSRHVDKRAIATVSGWTYSGCYGDAWNRTLAASSKSDDNMTVQLCTSYCSGLGYTLAGLESKNQCFCDSQIRGTAGTKYADSDCSYQCKGDTSQACGGNWRLTVYNTTKSSSTSTSSSKTSTTLTSTSTSKAATSTSTSKATTSTTTSKAATTSSVATYYGCYADQSSPRLLSGANTESTSMTPSTCQTFCSGKGYSLAGVSYGKQCYCGNSIDSTKKQSSETGCSYACTGNSALKCGGFYYLNVYSSSGTIAITSSSAASTTSASSTSKSSSTTTSKASSTTSSSFSASTSATTTSAAAAAGSSAIGAPNPPSATGTKQLFAHHMVGNTYSYTQSTWADDISQASAAGIDGFALNYGSDSWQPSRIADAYAAAKADGSFKLFLSMDVTSLGCSSTNDAQNLVNTVATYANNTAQAKVGGKVLLSTFAGENCKFGQGSYQDAWNYFDTLLAAKSINVYFVPAVFADISTFSSSTWMDGEFNWNSGWPMGGSPLGTYSDTSYMSALGSSKGYMAAVSPAFFTYYSPSSYNKNWIYRSDDWLLARRMEQMISQRNLFDLAEIISWNDYGESHYIGPIRADQPNSQGWTNGMPHTAWLEVIKYYAPAFKTGSYPSANDQLVLWSRPHPKDAVPTSPSMARPTGADNTDDLLYVWVVLKSAATVTASSGNNTVSWNLGAGVNKVSVKSAAGSIGAKIIRNGATVKSYDSTGSFTYTNTPTDYNFNYFVASA
ncbi:uncharacterized protein I206_105431 [Kwoniella pini CBS 10737]|uniref:WSC domain-containing protein n=1 Tax=Kwoniella pini CBS 10737 TaxID=1296096 RepID=A0A1B9I4A4_9TREE|nr:uncharacterized protein I206_03663 [Kwoniella pini CBS 10737]OCF50344.1 hypothetical protein I206_03663 [Kwoniella pini CBS 10737]